MIQTVLKSQTEVGLSIEGMQEKNCMQNGRRYRQKSWPELLNIFFSRLSLFAGVMLHVWLEPDKTFDWPVPLRKY